MRTLRTVDYRSSAVSSSASLSKAIRDRRYHELPELLGEAVLSERGPRNDRERTRAAKTDTKTDTIPDTAAAATTAATAAANPHPQTGNPLWEANSRGWTPMHVAATGSTEMPLKWWRWILRVQRIAPEREREPSTTGTEAPPVHRPCELWKRHTDTGQTVLVVGDPDGLGVVLDVAVGRVLVRGGLRVPGGTPRVADDGFGDALLAIEIALRTPESAHGRLEGGGGVLGNGDEGADLAGFSFLGVYHVVVVALEGREIGALDDVDAVAVAVAVDAVAADAFVIVAGVFCGGRHRKKGLAAGDQDRCR